MQTGVENEWSIKDILAHIIAWEQRLVLFLQRASDDYSPSMLPSGKTWDEIDAINQQTYLENKDKPFVEILTLFQQSYEAVLATVEAISETDLMDPHRFSWREGEPLGKLVAANTYWHYEAHYNVIQRWVEETET